MNEDALDPIELLRRRETEQLQHRPPPAPIPPPTIHYTDLPEDTSSGGRIAIEWNYYRREVGRLLAEGHEGKWVLIKGQEVVGIWDTEAEGGAGPGDRLVLTKP